MTCVISCNRLPKHSVMLNAQQIKQLVTKLFVIVPKVPLLHGNNQSYHQLQEWSSHLFVYVYRALVAQLENELGIMEPSRPVAPVVPAGVQSDLAAMDEELFELGIPVHGLAARPPPSARERYAPTHPNVASSMASSSSGPPSARDRYANSEDYEY
jgi:hypothetical protein